MTIPTLWLSAIMALASVAGLGLSWTVWRLPAFPGRLSLILCGLSIAWWTGFVAIEHASGTVDGKMFWAKMCWLGISGIGVFWGLFLWEYVRGQYEPGLRGRHYVGLALAITTWVLALTNDWHHLFYIGTAPVGVGPEMTVNYQHGPVWEAIVVLFWAIVVSMESMLLVEIFRTSGVYRLHYIIIAVTSLLPWITNILYVTGTFKLGGADATPPTFVICCAVNIWLARRRHLVELMPIAQGTLLRALPDPVFVLDPKRRIAEANPAASRLFGQASLVGLQVADLPQLAQSLQAGREVELDGCWYEVEDQTLSIAGREVGHLIVLHDVTRRKAAEDQLREQAIRDKLTGLHNRRFFEEIAPVMLADAERQGTSLAVAMIDVDHFKRLNDGHGHQAGDAVLRAVGAFLQGSVRQGDMVFRIGGEEFLIMLPTTREEHAIRVVDDWRSRFADQRVEHQGTILSCTFSAGVALFPDDATGVTELLHRADLALYQAKAAGRNRTMRWVQSS